MALLTLMDPKGTDVTLAWQRQMGYKREGIAMGIKVKVEFLGCGGSATVTLLSSKIAALLYIKKMNKKH